MTIKYYTQSQIDQQASVIGQRLRGITSDLTELVHSSVSKPAPNISSFLVALEEGFNPSSDAPSYDTGLAKDYSGTGWYKATDTGTVFNKGVPEGETHIFGDSPTEYVSVHNAWDASTYGERAAVSNITDMSNMFSNNNTFNKDISSWDVSSVTSMNSMFYDATSFNQDLSSWNVSSVSDMSSMFSGATSFNQDLSSWNVSSVTYMSYMFNQAYEFTQDLSQWCVSNISSEPENFEAGSTLTPEQLPVWGTCPRGEDDGTLVVPEEPVEYGPVGLKADYSGTGWYKATDTGTVFSKDVPALETKVFEEGGLEYVSVHTKADAKMYGERATTSNVTDMSGMFYDDAGFNSDISSWDVSSVTDMSNMFMYAYVFNQDISSWDVSNVTNMRGTFNGAYVFNQDLSSWDVSNVTNMSMMFLDARKFNSDISSWDVSSVSDMNSMFGNTFSFNQDLSGWCVTNIPTIPDYFDSGTSAWTLPKPVWGTCPRGENTRT